MGQKKHHHSSIPTSTLVTTKLHAADSGARPEKTHASLKVVLPKLIPALVTTGGNPKPAFVAIRTVLELHVQHVCIHFVDTMEKWHDPSFCIHAVPV
jgi:hypothetical protein